MRSLAGELETVEFKWIYLFNCVECLTRFSSLDEHTSKIIDEVVQTNFKDWTVIAVAHKLSSILHFDKVAVLDEGVLVEFDSPQTLLESPTSLFRSLHETSERNSVENSNSAAPKAS